MLHIFFIPGTLPRLVPPPPRHLPRRGGRGGRAERVEVAAQPTGGHTRVSQDSVLTAVRPPRPDDRAKEAETEDRAADQRAQPAQHGGGGGGGGGHAPAIRKDSLS